MVLLETLQFTLGLQLHQFVIFLLHITAAAFDHFFGPAGKAQHGMDTYISYMETTCVITS